MKGPLDRTKVVLRHLPHTITQSALMEQIDARFSGRYNWFSFRSGKQSLKIQSYSRAYIDFKQPEDVIEFAEFYDGHVFVNEKGTQFKTIVEYAPSQRVPKQWSKKDGREGTIVKDPEYLEFLEFVSKPVENLPSAEIQLERKEAERAGSVKEGPIVTPLMDFIRQKRAAKGGPRRSLANGKLMRRGTGASSSSSGSNVVKRGSEKRTSTMYVLREGGKSTNVKEKSTYVKRAEKSSTQSGSVVLDEEKGDTGKKKILLLKGKEKEIPNVTPPQQKVVYGSGGGRQNQNQNQRHEASGRIIRSILLKDTQQNQSLNHQDNNKDNRRPPRPSNVGPGQLSNGLQDDGSFNGEKQQQRSRNNNNKEKPDRVVWTPLRRSDGSHASDESLDTAEGTHGELNEHGRGGHFSSDNGSYKQSGRRGSSHNNTKDADVFSISNEGKPPKRAGYGSHEKRVWVQKPSSGS